MDEGVEGSGFDYLRGIYYYFFFFIQSRWSVENVGECCIDADSKG